MLLAMESIPMTSSRILLAIETMLSKAMSVV